MASPLDVLEDIAAAVDGRLEIIVDGGIRRGSDMVKAIALGATACSIGRPYLYGLAAAGEVGVGHVIDLFRDEMMRAMMMLGVTSIEELRANGRELLRHKSESFPSAPAKKPADSSNSYAETSL